MTRPKVIEKFRNMAESLNVNSNISVTSCIFNPPATSQQLNEAQSKFILTLEMIDFYSQSNGIYIQWERRKNPELDHGNLAAGSINLLPVQRVFSDWKNSIYFNENDPQRFLHPIDYFTLATCTALYLDGSNNPMAYYYAKGHKMKPLGVDFEGYLQLLLKSRGFWHWQLAIAGTENPDSSSTISTEERNFREIMPQLFPDFNQSDFRRLE